MALTEYQARVTRLLQYPAAPTSLYSTADITGWINQARAQLAGEAQCIRYLGTLSTVIDQRNYNFSAINTGVSATNGIQGAINVRQIFYTVGQGLQFVNVRNWEWFVLYNMNTPVPESGAPREWSQYGQGSSGQNTQSDASGSIYLDPPPDLVYQLTLDCQCYPIALTDNNTVEAIPWPWTDAVPFLAAYYALLSSQTSARTADAERMFNYYTLYVERARAASNPSVNRWMYQQSPDPTMMNKLGVSPKAGGQQ